MFEAHGGHLKNLNYFFTSFCSKPGGNNNPPATIPMFPGFYNVSGAVARRVFHLYTRTGQRGKKRQKVVAAMSSHDGGQSVFNFRGVA